MASDSSADAQKQLRMRRRVAEEIVSTERSYVDSLQAIHDVFAQPMRERRIVSEQQASTLFSDIQVCVCVSHCHQYCTIRSSRHSRA